MFVHIGVAKSKMYFQKNHEILKGRGGSRLWNSEAFWNFRRQGGGVKTWKPSVVGYGYFLELPISHFVTAATKFSCCSSNKKMSPLFFISHTRPLLPFFSLNFAGLLPTFSFSLSFSCSIFQICGHDNKLIISLN